jgi:hypothetical protein
MGRYAFFSTGIEYKFRFAEQCSSDITKFKGKLYSGSDEDNMVHRWIKSEDEPLIKEILKIFSENLGLDEIDITQFSKDIDGTHQLKYHLLELTNNYTFILGYIIYHQLQYVDNLSVNFEL